MSKLIIRPLSGIAEVIYNNGADYRVCTITDDESVKITIDSDLEFLLIQITLYWLAGHIIVTASSSSLMERILSA